MTRVCLSHSDITYQHLVRQRNHSRSCVPYFQPGNIRTTKITLNESQAKRTSCSIELTLRLQHHICLFADEVRSDLS